ncbi:hypothetical protein QR685DRAFT_444280 [Neurospora intermedia]|uniref:Uncharacterized protein n=1 Tax=Neurospora intermedia TaxID=5142 RepID=A0ABR3D995_NEUIN
MRRRGSGCLCNPGGRAADGRKELSERSMQCGGLDEELPLWRDALDTGPMTDVDTRKWITYQVATVQWIIRGSMPW